MAVADWLSLLVDRLEVVVQRPGGDLLSHVPGGGVGGAEVDPLPQSGVDHILEQCAAAVVVAMDTGYRRGPARPR